VRVRELVIDEDREDHIARHGVTISEVQDVVFGRYLAERTRDGRLLLIGQTRGGRYLAIVVAPRGGNVFGLVTARDAADRERARFRARKA
jgi:uncharacterized DUF497 family protein